MKAIRGRLLDFADGLGLTCRYIEDGVLVVVDGRIRAIGDAAALLPGLPAGTPVDDHTGRLILPGFIDLHIHLPQTRVIASYGTQLMAWLERYTFIAEQAYADPAHAALGAAFFLDELRRNGTTTAAVYGSVHAGSVEALFVESSRRGMAMIAGKSMMDRNAPAALLDTAQGSYDEAKDLIARWHGRARQYYAVTPRFAVTSSAAQLDVAGSLLREHPTVYLQTHLAENHDEIAAVAALFPAAADYTDVYESAGLLGPRSLFGHCLHLSSRALDRLAETGSVAVSCPTSNLFLGSGLFDRAGMLGREKPVRVGLATDVGGGTSYSMLRTGAEAYKVAQLRGDTLSALAAFAQITRGNAEALGLDAEIGTLEPGSYADLVVLATGATPAMAHRLETVETLEEELFVLLTLGDDRNVAATYIAGER
jgi:guanine deaminase